MLMVIFGAGASWDSYERLPPPNVNQFRLPLAKDLFDSRFGDDYQLFPKCQPLIQRLQRPKISVESELEEFQAQAEGRPIRRVQLAAVRYYLNYMLSRCQSRWKSSVTKGVTNYQTMLDQIDDQRERGEKVCLATFNYDTLLERAVEDSLDVPLNKIDHYVASDYKVIKPHGSTSWAHPISNFQSHRSTTQDLISDIIANAASLNVDSESYETVSEDPFQRPSQSPLFPALAIPVENKQHYECPQQHMDALEKCLPEVDKTLIVGWHASENEFLDFLARGGLLKRGYIMVVSGSEQGANQVIARMRARWRNTGLVDVHLEAAKSEGFSRFISSSEWETFLRIAW